MSGTTRQQPPWQSPPQPLPEAKLPPLKIWNSLTRSKTPFVPLDKNGRRVTWYACGPTVYDDAHLGHARNYVSTDIIRRVMKDYFKFDVEFVMNITDVDDKIIVRGRQQHLFHEYRIKQQRESKEMVTADCDAAIKVYLSKNLPLVDHDLNLEDLLQEIQSKYALAEKGGALDAKASGDKEAKIKMHIKTALAASKAIVSYKKDQISLEKLNQNAQDVLLPYLDSLHGMNIDAENHAIFTTLTKKFEDRFMEDVRALNCLDPDIVTRVTEYGPQIVRFVEKVQENGFAYRTSDGSVYFDIQAFEAARNNYARLEPWNRNDRDLQADGEGALTKKSSEKRSDADFALWKSSKPGEPSWPSPWGGGRPGWHIECSAMASDRLGSQIDIHSGGVDLAFPHHDNELAQSEAYWCDKNQEHQHQWVNYFMHMGHLSIQGSKMSKSLKNFTTIREALSRGDWTPRGLRIVFLLGGWREGIEITEDLVKEGSSWEDKVNVNDILENKLPEDEDLINEELQNRFDSAKFTTHNALCDSFNTARVMRTISEFITDYNSIDRQTIASWQTLLFARWITSMVKVFGLDDAVSADDTAIGWSGIDIPKRVKPWLTSISRIRDDLRRRARSPNGLDAAGLQELSKSSFNRVTSADDDEETKPYASVLSSLEFEITSLSLSSPSSSSLPKRILQLCDRVRDVDLWNLGIYLEDREGDQPALIRPVTRELRAAKAEQEFREAQKAKAKADREKEAAERAERGRLSHLDMYRTTEYSAWDEEGLPLKDVKGDEINKSKGKKLRKDWEKQKKLHEAWQKANEDTS
ncbi:MAG: hypothetical protein Q9190_004902 [Brigantiaea leucoxantha]